MLGCTDKKELFRVNEERIFSLLLHEGSVKGQGILISVENNMEVEGSHMETEV